MAADSFAGIQGIEMSADEVDTFLQSQGFGVLSLARDGEAYGIPISFGYDGTQLYFVLLRPGERSKKEEFVRETDTASFLVYDVGDDDWPALLDAIEENAWFPSLFSETQPMQDILGWRLVVDEMTGQRSHDAP
jgi:hypothetical protein